MKTKEEIIDEKNRAAILKRLDALIHLLELRNKQEKDISKKIFDKINNLVGRATKENKLNEKEYYWRWQFLIQGLKKIENEKNEN